MAEMTAEQIEAAVDWKQAPPDAMFWYSRRVGDRRESWWCRMHDGDVERLAHAPHFDIDIDEPPAGSGRHVCTARPEERDRG